MRLELKKEYGITLIALIVTIVVLSTLSVVLINSAFGENGILSYVKNAQLIENKEEAIEKLSIVLSSAKIEQFTNVDYNENEFLNNYITKSIAGSEFVDKNYVAINGHIFEIDRKGLKIGSYIGTTDKFVSISLGKIVAEKNETITATLRIGQNIDKNNSKWELKKYEEGQEINIGTDADSYTHTGINETMELSAGEIGKYYLHILTVNTDGEDIKEKVIGPIEIVRIPAKGIALGVSSTNVAKGNTVEITYTITPNDADNKNVRWEVGNSAIASINENGTITGVKAGTTTIRAIAEGGTNVEVEGSITVYEMRLAINNEDMTGITVNNGTTNIGIGIKPKYKAEIDDGTGYKTTTDVTWSISSNTIGATINNSNGEGVVSYSGINEGTATITATSTKINDLKSSKEITGELKIYNSEGMWQFASNVNNGTTYNNKTITLCNSLNIGSSSSKKWVPIGENNNNFNGTFDGNEKTLSGLYIDSTASNIGLFAKNSGIIKKITVEGTVKSTGMYIGGICGCNNNIIQDCINKCSVTGEEKTGGICGISSGGTIRSCYNMGTINSNNTSLKYSFGGIAGLASGTCNIEKCVNECNFTINKGKDVRRDSWRLL